MFEEPSSGSKHTMYFPCRLRTNNFNTVTIIPEKPFNIYKTKKKDTYLHRRACINCTDASTRLSGSTMMAFSSSSDTSTQELKEDLIMLMTRSLDRMSSFFTWSPVTLVLPAMPYLAREERGADWSDQSLNESFPFGCTMKHNEGAVINCDKCLFDCFFPNMFVIIIILNIAPVRKVWKAHYLLDLCPGELFTTCAEFTFGRGLR